MADTEFTRKIFGETLAEYGTVDESFVVLTADSGDGGIEVFRKRKDDIDSVILDYVMPGLSGREVLARIKEINTDVKVIVASGYSKNGQAKEMMETDLDGFIQKPSTLVELMKKIREVLDR